MKTTVSILICPILFCLMLSYSYADTISFGNGRFLFSVNGGLGIDAEDLDSKWHRKARSLCKDTKYKFYLFPVYINDNGGRATLIIKDREAEGVTTIRNSEIKLKGTLVC